ncbi:MAG: methyltransferase domain-containing protein [Actinomycetota bacterium]|nr:methyltransferase domain-containing protein [Actinomycetota bacterium]
MTSPPLSREEAIRYWDDRHRQEGDLRSGGHIGWDSYANEAFYVRRTASLLEIIGDRVGGQDPILALDAGCGKGPFSRALARCGIVVDGIDTSPEAIAYCQEHGTGRYQVATLADFRSAFLYDVVFSIDVLFHILEDGDWEASLTNLASLVRLAGTLIVADEAKDDRHVLRNYIVHRPLSAYTAVLEPLGFTFEGFRPYDFRENAVGLMVFARAR